MSLYQRRSNSGGLPTTNGGNNSHSPYGTPQQQQHQQHSMYPQQQYNPSPTKRMMADHKIHNKARRNSSSRDLLPPTISKWLSHMVILFFSVILIMYYRSSYHKLNQKFQSGIQENNSFKSRIDTLERKGKSRDDKVMNLEQTLDRKNRDLSNLQKAKRDLLSENKVLTSKLNGQVEKIKRAEDMTKESGGAGAGSGAGAGVTNGRLVRNERGMLEVENEQTRIKRERKEKASAARVEGLKTYIQEESRREILDRWGQGPHQVRIEMEFPEETELNDPSLPIRYLTIELAPISIMPHSVHIFLEQVHHKLWEGTSFVINAEHIIQASALSGDEQNPLKDYATPFKTARLDTLAFQEYDELYPHEMFTVGFAGRPGGRDFYLNMMDNTDSHGPGGQEQHDLEEEADPCFGKVVDGFDHLKVMEKRPTKGELFERRVRIKSTTILTAANMVATPTVSVSTSATNVPPAASPNNPAAAAAATSTTNANNNPDPKNTGPSASMNINAAAELNPNIDPRNTAAMNNAAAATNRRGPPNTVDADRNRRGPPNGASNMNQNRVV